MTYFELKRELKMLFGNGLKAKRQKNNKYITFILFSLDNMKKDLLYKSELDSFGLYLINKDIEKLQMLLSKK